VTVQDSKSYQPYYTWDPDKSKKDMEESTWSGHVMATKKFATSHFEDDLLEWANWQTTTFGPPSINSLYYIHKDAFSFEALTFTLHKLAIQNYNPPHSSNLGNNHDGPSGAQCQPGMLQ